MYTPRKSSRRALARIHNAIQAGFGYGWTEGGDAGGGGAEKKPDDKAKSDAEKPLTGEALAQALKMIGEDGKKSLIADARRQWESEAADKARVAKEAADLEDAKKKGEWEKLATEAQAKLANVERERKVEKSMILAAGEHEGYPLTVFEKYVMPGVLTGIDAKATDADIDKAVTAAVKQYVDDNPRQVKGNGGAPPPLPSTANRGIAANRNNQRQTPRQASVASSRF